MIIKQNPPLLRPQRVGDHAPATLPDFRNLGVMLRILLITNAMGLAAALVRAPMPSDIVPIGIEIAGVLEPLLLMQVLILVALDPWLRKLPYLWGCAAVLLITITVVALAQVIDQRVLHLAQASWWRAVTLSLIVTGTVLVYFNYRARALSPALIRSEPKRAESALEDMADLFRAVMADNRDLIPLADEIALCKQYLNLEVLRLGERLQVQWHVDNMPADALVPPLILQPLIENAVYHGVQASNEPGTVSINIYQRRGELHAVLSNPIYPDGRSHSGNRMAIDNIRERLALHFDSEAALSAKAIRNLFQVHIHMPYRKQPRA